MAEFRKPGTPRTDFDRAREKFYQLLETDRTSPEFQKLYNEVDRLLIEFIEREKRLKEA